MGIDAQELARLDQAEEQQGGTGERIGDRHQCRGDGSEGKHVEQYAGAERSDHGLCGLAPGEIIGAFHEVRGLSGRRFVHGIECFVRGQSGACIRWGKGPRITRMTRIKGLCIRVI